jgi:gamma-glutamyl-gamma-aminobutyrate hydrolase PuuD
VPMIAKPLSKNNPGVMGTPVGTIGLHVQGRFMKRQIERMFLEKGGYHVAAGPSDADMIVWTGGEDVNPAMYKEKPIPGTCFDTGLDIEDMKVYNIAELTGAWKVGICRGAQLLCVANGGKLWQDVDKHNGSMHDVKDCVTGEIIKINSLHHQQLRLPEHGELVAYTRLSTNKDAYGDHWDEKTQGNDLTEVDVEAAWFDKTNSLCFQPHPEFSDPTTRRYFFDLIERYCSPF